MPINTEKYCGPIDGIDPKDMWGDGYLDDCGWVASVGCGTLILEKRSGYKNEYISSIGMDSMWHKWQDILNN